MYIVTALMLIDGQNSNELISELVDVETPDEAVAKVRAGLQEHEDMYSVLVWKLTGTAEAVYDDFG